MGVKVAIAGREYEAPPQLKRIVAQLVLAMATRAGALAGCHIIATKYVEQVPDSQSGGTISNTLFIDEQRKRDAGFLPEEAGVVLVPQPDCRNARSFAVEFRLVLAQLRDVLAAEDSAIVPQKDHHRWRFGPDRSQPHLIAFGIRQTDVCQPCAQ